MYGFLLQQEVLLAVATISQQSGDAYIKDIVQYICIKNNVELRGRAALSQRIRRMLKLLSDEQVLKELQGELSAQRVPKLYYKQQQNFIVMKADFLKNLLKPMVAAFGGMSKFLGMGKGLLLENESKIAAAIDKREEQLKVENSVPNLDTHKVMFGTTVVDGNLIILESYLYTENEELKIGVAKKYALDEFLNLMDKLAD